MSQRNVATRSSAASREYCGRQTEINVATIVHCNSEEMQRMILFQLGDTIEVVRGDGGPCRYPHLSRERVELRYVFDREGRLIIAQRGHHASMVVAGYGIAQNLC